MTPDFRTARERMVREQIAGRGITDARVLDAMRRIPRHLFVDEGLRDRAYGDYPLPIGEGQTISQPYMVALMAQTLGLSGHERVLEIGTGSGYGTAVLAELAARVYSVERLPRLTQRARRLLEGMGYLDRVQLRNADGTMGWPEEAPFDGIIVTAGSPEVPDTLVRQLSEDGRLVIPVGDVYAQQLLRVTREGDSFRRENICPCVFVKLVGRHGWRDGGTEG